MKKYLYILTLIFLITSCVNIFLKEKLSVSNFNFTDDLKKTMNNLSLKSKLLDMNKERILISTNKFSITNIYVIPLLYDKISSNPDYKNSSEKELNNFIFATAYNVAMKKLLYIESVDNGFDATQDEIDLELNKISGNNIDLYKSKFTESSIKFEFILENVKQDIAIKKYKEDLLKNIQVSDNEIKKFYDDNPEIAKINPRAVVRHIQLSTNNMNDKQKETQFNKLKNILSEARSKNNFNELAKKYSDDTASRESGGRLGDYIEKGYVTKEIEDIIFNLKPGEISDIIKTEYGYNIFKVDEIQTERKKTFESLKKDIEKILIYKKQIRMTNDISEKIGKKYNLKKHF